jgi:hypothetical protein
LSIELTDHILNYSITETVLFRAILALLFVCFFRFDAIAQTITPATGGLNISVDNFATSTSVPLSAILIEETSPAQLSPGTVRLRAPTGFQWDTSAMPTITITSIRANKITVVPGSQAISGLDFEFTTEGTSVGPPPNNIHTIQISGLRVLPAQGTPIVSGEIRNLGSAAPGGSTNYGSLSLIAGADNRIRVETIANGTGAVVPSQDVIAGDEINVYAIVRDQYNNFKRNEVATWSVQNTTGGIVGSNLTPAGDGKSATFSSDLVGSANIRATFGALTSIDSGLITVIPDAAQELFIATQPSSSATAGVAFGTQPIVQIRDQFGNIIADDNLTQITASRMTGTGVLQGTKTITVSGGIATFTNLSHNISNEISLIFDTSGLPAVESDLIQVNPATAAGLTFTTQPQNGNRNTNLVPGPVVQIIDAFGNFVSQSGTNITTSLVSGGGNLQGTPTVTSNADGKASFTQIRFNQNGTKVIKASATGLTDSPNSDEFTIADAGTLAGFVVEKTSTGGNIDPQTAGVQFNIRIRAVDGLGATLDGGGSPSRANFTGSVDLTTTGIFSATTDSTSIGPFVNGVFDPHPVTLEKSGNVTITAKNASGSENGTSNTFFLNPADADIDESFLFASDSTLIADGISETTISIQLVDSFGNYMIGDISETVAIAIVSGGGVLSATTGNGNGTYSAVLTAQNDVGTTVLKASIDDVDITTDNLEIIFTFGAVSTYLVEREDGGNVLTQTAGSGFNIRITALDAFDNVVESFSGSGATVNITAPGATFLSGNGTTASFTNGVLASHSVNISNTGTFQINARRTGFTESGNSNSFVVNPGIANATTSIITAGKTFLENNGVDNTLITVRLRDSYNNNLNTGGDIVTLSATNGTLSGVTDNSNGTYTATFTSVNATSLVTGVVTGTVNSVTISDDVTITMTEVNLWTANAGGSPSNKTDWLNTGNWSLGSVPAVGQIVIIPTAPSGGNVFPNVNNTDLNLDIIVVEAGANLSIDSRNVTVNQEVSGEGSVLAANSTFTINGDVSISNFIAGSSNITFSGSVPQTVSGDFTGNSITFNQSVTSENFIEAFTYMDIASGQTLTIPSGAFLNIAGDIEVNGNLVANNATLTFGGAVNGSNISITNTNLEFVGSTEQEIVGFSDINNLLINNTSGVVSNSDLVVNGTLTLTNGILTVNSGNSLVANTKDGNIENLRMRREITGSRGWRLISPPIASTFDDLLDGTLTQGFPGATLYDAANDTLVPSVLWYVESIEGTDNQRFRRPSNASDALTVGRGLFVYFFGDVPTDDRYNMPFPHTLEIQSEEFDGNGTEVILPVTYTAAADTGWNLVGNPFAAGIDWDDGTWQKTNMDNAIYVWDNVTQQYLTWNGTGGSLGSGKIAPFQAFWVKANGAGNPSLRVRKSSKTTGANFYKASAPAPVIGLQLNSSGLTSEVHFTFTEDAKTGKDPYDAYRLLPLNTVSYLEFYTTLSDGSQLVINNIPRRFGQVLEIPLHVGGYLDGASIKDDFSLSVCQLDDIPDGWELILVDHQNNTKTNLRAVESVRLSEVVSIHDSVTANLAPDYQLLERIPQKSHKPRFTIRIDPGDDAADLPNKVLINHNYPNPFNSQTTLRYGVPIEMHVNLEVYDVLGRRVATLVNESRQAGFYEVPWSASNLASGVYIYRLIAGGKMLTGKMLHLK